jgi:broad specificity phosphatase PhoE
MSRHRETADEVSLAFSAAAIAFPGFCVDPGWDEFDLGAVYREIAPQLCAEDPEFRREYEEMLQQVRISAGAHAANIHRRWLACDTKLVDAWIAGRYYYSRETWDQFRDRVAGCRLKMGASRARGNVLVVTSATPIAIWAGLSLEIFDDRLMRLAGVLYNTSYSVMRLREEKVKLFTLNVVSHLAGLGMCTHR